MRGIEALGVQDHGRRTHLGPDDPGVGLAAAAHAGGDDEAHEHGDDEGDEGDDDGVEQDRTARGGAPAGGTRGELAKQAAARGLFFYPF